MKNFSLKKKENYRRGSKGKLLKIGILIAMVCLIVFFGRGMFGGILARTTMPIFQFRAWVAESSGTIPSYLRERSALQSQIDSLEEEVATLQTDKFRAASLEAENKELRGLLGASNETPRIAAGVTARPPYLPYDALLIDKGTRDGVQEDAVVYHHGDEAIGVISHVYEHSALVTLFSTPDVVTTVYIIGPDIYTSAHGEGGGVLRVSVPQGILLSAGDMVVLPSLAHGIVGAISAVQSEPTKPEQSGFIVGDTPIQSIRFVAVSSQVQRPVSFEEAAQYVNTQKEALFTVPVPEDIMIDEATSTGGGAMQPGDSSATSTGRGEVLEGTSESPS